MIPDYYQILDISTDALISDIKCAYRQKAMKYHPDHNGGSTHEKMLQINEAFEVLSNLTLRQQYDCARAHPNDSKAQEKAAANATQAREQAQHYPRDWTEFESWLNGVVIDFTNVDYSSHENGGLFSLPSEGKSNSLFVFMITGAIGAPLLYLWLKHNVVTDTPLDRYPTLSYRFVRKPFIEQFRSEE